MKGVSSRRRESRWQMKANFRILISGGDGGGKKSRERETANESIHWKIQDVVTVNNAQHFFSFAIQSSLLHRMRLYYYYFVFNFSRWAENAFSFFHIIFDFKSRTLKRKELEEEKPQSYCQMQRTITENAEKFMRTTTALLRRMGEPASLSSEHANGNSARK